MTENIIEVDGHRRSVSLQVYFVKEGKYIIARSPALDLSAFGETIEEAKEAFGESVDVFIDNLVERGTLNEVLTGMSWTKEHDKWIPPYVISSSVENVEIPMVA